MKNLLNSYAAQLISAVYFILVFVIASMLVSCGQYKGHYMSDEQHTQHQYELAECVTQLQDVKSWMMEDVYNGVLSPELAEYYINVLDQQIELLSSIHQNTYYASARKDK